MATLATLLVRVIADTTGFVSGMAVANTALGRTADRFTTTGAALSKTGSVMTRNLTVPILLVAGAAAKMAIEFDQSMSQVDALVGASDKQMQLYKTTILAMAHEFPQGPQELVKALYFVTSSGFEGAQALSVLRASAKAAAAGLGDTASVAQVVTSAVNAYGISNLKAKEATDVLLAAVREGKAEPEDFANTLGRVIPVAEAMGVEFHEVGGAIAAMSLSGLDAAESVTAFRGIFMSLLKPSKDSRKAFDEIGMSVSSLRDDIAKNGVNQALQELRQRIGDNKDMMGRLFPNVRALAGFLNLTGRNAEKNTKVFKELAGATGDTDRAFQTASEHAAFQLQTAWSSIKSTLIEVGDLIAPSLVAITQGLAGVIKKFKELDEGTQQTIIKMALALAAVGLTLKLLGGLLSAIGSLIKVFAWLIAPLKVVWALFVALATALAAFLGVSVAVAAAIIVAIVGAAVLIIMNWEKVKAFLVATWNFLAGVAVAVWNAIFGAIRAAVEATVSVAMSAWSAVTAFLSGVWNGILGLVRSVWNGAIVQAIIETMSTIVSRIVAAWNLIYALVSAALGLIISVISTQFGMIKTVVGAVVSGIAVVWSAGWKIMSNIISVVWNVIKTVVGAGITIIKTIIGVGVTAVKLVFQTGWDAISKIFKVVWNTISTIVTTAWAMVQAIIKFGLAVIRGDWSAAWNAIKAFLSAAWNGIKSIVSTAIGAVVSFMAALPGRILGALGNLLGLLVSKGKDLITGLWNGIKDIVRAVLSYFISLPRIIIAALGSLLGILVQAGKDLIQGLINGIENMIGSAISAVKNVGSKIVGAAKSAFGIGSPSKVFEEIGIQVVAGLLRGLQKKEDALVNQLDKLAGRIKERMKGAMKDARLETLKELEKLVAGAAKKLNQAQKMFDKVREKMATMSDAIASGVSSLADTLTTFGDVDLGRPKMASDFIDQLLGDIDRAKGFAKKIASLARKGLDEGLLTQLASTGNLEMARMLDNASAEQIQFINRQLRELAAFQKTMTEKTNEALYGKEFKDTLQALTKAGKEFDRLEERIGRFADQINKDIAAITILEKAAEKAAKALEQVGPAVDAIKATPRTPHVQPGDGRGNDSGGRGDTYHLGGNIILPNVKNGETFLKDLKQAVRAKQGQGN